MGAQRGFEQRLSVQRVVAREEQEGAPLLCFGFARGLRRQPVQRLCARVQALRLRQRVELRSQVGARQGNASPRAGRRPRGIRAALRATQLVPRTLQITRGRRCPG